MFCLDEPVAAEDEGGTASEVEVEATGEESDGNAEQEKEEAETAEAAHAKDVADVGADVVENVQLGSPDSKAINQMVEDAHDVELAALSKKSLTIHQIGTDDDDSVDAASKEPRTVVVGFGLVAVALCYVMRHRFRGKKKKYDRYSKDDIEQEEVTELVSSRAGFTATL